MTRVAHHALEKVSSPRAKGIHYWYHQWKQLLDRMMLARRETERVATDSFRASPAFSEAKFLTALQAEREAIDTWLAYQRADAAGEHE
jgi:hypothetical protein